jgi:hypothetical protein
VNFKNLFETMAKHTKSKMIIFTQNTFVLTYLLLQIMMAKHTKIKRIIFTLNTFVWEFEISQKHNLNTTRFNC